MWELQAVRPQYELAKGPGSKRCFACRINKPVTDNFHEDPRHSSGIATLCTSCVEIAKEQFKAHAQIEDEQVRIELL